MHIRYDVIYMSHFPWAKKKTACNGKTKSTQIKKLSATKKGKDLNGTKVSYAIENNIILYILLSPLQGTEISRAMAT